MDQQTKQTTYLSIADILGAQDLEERDVAVPEWGGMVKVRGFSKERQQQLRERCMVNGELDQNAFELQLFVEGVVEPQFSPDHAALLREKAAGPIDRVIKEILHVTGLSEEAQKATEARFPH